MLLDLSGGRADPVDAVEQIRTAAPDAPVIVLSDEADGFTGQRITAARWDASLPGAQAAARAGRAIGWPELAADAVWLAEKPG